MEKRTNKHGVNILSTQPVLNNGEGMLLIWQLCIGGQENCYFAATASEHITRGLNWCILMACKMPDLLSHMNCVLCSRLHL